MSDSQNALKNENDNLTTIVWWAIIFFIPILFGLISLLLGKDFNWDLRNYHYYNAYAFLENRYEMDIAPAQLQTYLPPFLDLPFYWMTNTFPSRTTGFLMGYIQGVNFILLFLIFWDIAQIKQKWKKIFVGTCLIIISGIAPGFLAELGTTMNDNLISLFVLSPLLLLMKGIKRIDNDKLRQGLLYVILAGVVMGIGVGLKATVALYALGFAFALLFVYKSWHLRIISFITYGFAGVIGALIGGGYWWWEMWIRYQNPLFPFYNNIFASPYIGQNALRLHPFSPQNLFEYFAWPIVFTLNSLRVGQFQFSDIRFTLIYILAILWLIISLWRIFHLNAPQNNEVKKYVFFSKQGNFLLIFFGTSFVLWMIQFSIYRYLIPLEILVPLTFFIITERFVQTTRGRISILVAAAVLMLIFFKPYSWGRVPWKDPYLGVNTASFETSSPDGAVVIMLGKSPMSYVIPKFPENFIFVSPESNLELKEHDGFSQEIKTLVENYEGTIYVLYSKEEKSVKFENSMARLGINAKIRNCSELSINIPWQHMEICLISKVTEDQY